jgi:hypothetical protein
MLPPAKLIGDENVFIVPLDAAAYQTISGSATGIPDRSTPKTLS